VLQVSLMGFYVTYTLLYYVPKGEVVEWKEIRCSGMRLLWSSLGAFLKDSCCDVDDIG
jgi:hypothetical protein